MLNKIDYRIFDNIKALGKNNTQTKFNAILHSDEYLETKNILMDKDINYLELPFISSFAITVTASQVYNLAWQNSVRYISSDTKVSSLIYDSKKFMGVDIIANNIKNHEPHSCVIIDTGVYPHIDFLLGKNRIIKFIDIINDRDIPYDDNGHGTFVAGILSGNSITSKYSGIDNYTNIIVIKALDNDGETTSVKILQAMQWVLENKLNYNIKVVCMSFGSVFGDYNDPLMKGAEVLWDNGISVVCAAGNNGPEDKSIMSPGTAKKVITVGSLSDIHQSKITVADFSSRGPVFNYYKPDLVVPGENIISTNVFSKNKNFYTKMSGTSVSTPMVAGIVSLLYYINPNYSPDQIKYIILNSCIEINGDRNVEGRGWLDLREIVL